MATPPATTNAADTAVVNPLSHLITDPVRNVRFIVTITPNDKPAAGSTGTWGANFGKLGFVSLSGLSVTTEPIAYREGGYNTNFHQFPGQSSFTPITLSKGVMLGKHENSLWMKRLFQIITPKQGTEGASGAGLDFRCQLDIQVLSHPNPGAWAGSDSTAPQSSILDQHTSLRFRVYNAWITNLTYGSLDAGANTALVEEMTLVHEGFEVIYGTGYTKDQSAKSTFSV
jgi:phage tail-like protein